MVFYNGLCLLQRQVSLVKGGDSIYQCLPFGKKFPTIYVTKRPCDDWKNCFSFVLVDLSKCSVNAEDSHYMEMNKT